MFNGASSLVQEKIFKQSLLPFSTSQGGCLSDKGGEDGQAPFSGEDAMILVAWTPLNP